MAGNKGKDELNRDGHTNKREELLREEAWLKEQIAEYHQERDKIKQAIGQIGGKKYSKTDMIINIVFFGVIIALFLLEVFTHWIPTFLSIEIGILLVSVKIIFMIHTQQKTNHYQFWVLNTLEFRMNEMYKRIKKMDKALDVIKGNE
jgi:predicted RND superfamily exporter protein